MSLSEFFLALVPSLVWLCVAMTLAIRAGGVRTLVIAILAGLLIAAPIGVTETWVVSVLHPDGRFATDFVQQVLAAAVCEESFKFLAIVLVFRSFSRDRSTLTDLIFTVALGVAVGCMTVENVAAVAHAESSQKMATDRLLTMIAGHPSFQLVMAWLLTASFDRRLRVGWLVAAWAFPVALHAWYDLSESLFQDEPHPGSSEDTMLYALWITSVFTIAVLAVWLTIQVVIRRKNFIQGTE
ncbi:PrsW family glutamic-type intramembrane protease [Roseiconus nitratireducens]|nr:PrsW family glutamic-type intramembrane protease [Roseiconus nitratireducens]